jgi:hypothetical protein
MSLRIAPDALQSIISVKGYIGRGKEISEGVGEGKARGCRDSSTFSPLHFLQPRVLDRSYPQ